MRSKIAAGNWKMNKTFPEAEDLVNEIGDFMAEQNPDVTVILCPPYIYLEMATDVGQETGFFTGAQDISEHEQGAYTGDISAPMVRSVGADFCIIGHSERRKYHHETDPQLLAKVRNALKHDLRPIFCCGELSGEREQGRQLDVVRDQLTGTVFQLSAEEFRQVIIAYEPVWAIGTGVNATPEQAQEMHAFIRSLIATRYGDEVASNIHILYGGSCNSKNARDLFTNPDVDGGLIGGASLDAGEFIRIIQSF
jgi:triosephosphate isomerase